MGGKMQLATDVCNWDNGFSSDVAKLRRLDSTGCTLMQNQEINTKILVTSNKHDKIKCMQLLLQVQHPNETSI